MKGFLLMSFMVLGFAAFSQKRAEFIMWPYGTSDRIQFAETISYPNATTDSIYGVALNFIRSRFHTQLDTIYADRQKHTILLRGTYLIPIEELGERGKGYVSFTFSISCYYKALRYKITDLRHVGMDPNCVYGGALENERAEIGGVLFPFRYWESLKAKAYYRIQNTIEQLKENLATNFAQ